MGRSDADVATPAPRGVLARSSVLLAALLGCLLACSCASRQQVEKLEERLVSMDDTLQQVAAGQTATKADTAARLELLENYLVAEGKEKTRLLQDLKSQRQLREASGRAAAWSSPVSPVSPITPVSGDIAQKTGPGQPLPQAAPVLAPVPEPTPAPAAMPAPAMEPPPVPEVPAAVVPAAPAPPEVVKRRVSKPKPGWPGQGMEDMEPADELVTSAAAPPEAAPPSGLDPKRLVSKPILQQPEKGAPADKAKPAKAANPTATYEEAVKLVQAGKVDRGRELLNTYIRENPKGAMLPNAYYWLGETYYFDKRYAQAILTFKEVTTRYPKHDKAAAALLKIGYAYEQLGDKPNARFYLGTLVKEYPRSNSATLAKEALQGRLK